MSDVTHQKCGLRILRFEKKQWVEFLPPNERVKIQSWARPDEFVRYERCKSSQHRKILSLSPHVKKPLNSKRWIKILWILYFRDFYVYEQLWTFSCIVDSVYVTSVWLWIKLCNWNLCLLTKMSQSNTLLTIELPAYITMYKLFVLDNNYKQAVIRCWAFVAWVCVGASQRISLSVLVRNPHKGPVRKTRSGRRKIGPRDIRQESQSRKGHSQQKGVEQNSRQRWKQGREFKSALLVALWEFSLGYMLALAHRMYKKCHRLPSLVLGADHVCSFVLFFQPLGCALRICKEMCNTSGRRWEKPLDESLAMSGLRKLR